MTDTKVWQYFVYAAAQSILKVTVFFVVEVRGYLYSIEKILITQVDDIKMGKHFLAMGKIITSVSTKKFC